MLGSSLHGAQTVRTEARFPGVAATAGHYESFYIKASQPGGGRAIWLRHTTHQRPGAELRGALWLTVFDSEAPGPRAIKASFSAADVTAPTGTYIQIAGAMLEPGRAHGSIADGGVQANWELGFSDESGPLHHLPRELLYRSRLPKTKLLSPHPMARFDGSLTLDGETIELDGWPGMVGHNWGSEHAEKWIWIQASDLGGVKGDYLDVAAGRIKLGPATTPWLANGRIVLEGDEYRLGGFGHAYGTELSERPDGCEFTLPGRNVNVKGRVGASPKDFVAWVYADPKGPEHNVLNCSISDLELKVERPDRRHARVEMAGVAAYELGTRDTDLGVPLQPYPDG